MTVGNSVNKNIGAWTLSALPYDLDLMNSSLLLMKPNTDTLQYILNIILFCIRELNH